MKTGVRTFAVVAVLLPCFAFGQVQTKTEAKTVRVSGRLTDTNGVPLTELNLNFETVFPLQPPGPVSTLKPDGSGRFVLPIESRKEYEMYIPEPGVQSNYRLVARIAADEEWDVDFGALSRNL